VEADGIICYRDTSFAAYPTSDLRKKEKDIIERAGKENLNDGVDVVGKQINSGITICCQRIKRKKHKRLRNSGLMGDV